MSDKRRKVAGVTKGKRISSEDQTRRSQAIRRAAAARRPVQARLEPPLPPPLKLRKTHLSKPELEEFREMLIQKRRTLLGDLSGMAEHTAGQQTSGNLSTMPTHMADVGTDNFEHEFTLGLLESEQAMLREINDALKRIDDRTYGVCLGTGEPIPKARLKAKPWAKYTVDYARMLEKGLVRAPELARDEEEPTEETAPAEEEEEVPEEEAEPEE